MDIRPFDPADLNACRALLADPQLEPPPAFYVAEHEGAIIGCAGFECAGNGALLRDGIVREDCRGQGIGRFLLFFCLREIGRKDGVEFVRVEAGDAGGFFEKQGFRRETGDVFVKRLAVCR